MIKKLYICTNCGRLFYMNGTKKIRVAKEMLSQADDVAVKNCKKGQCLFHDFEKRHGELAMSKRMKINKTRPK